MLQHHQLHCPTPRQLLLGTQLSDQAALQRLRHQALRAANAHPEREDVDAARCAINWPQSMPSLLALKNVVSSFSTLTKCQIPERRMWKWVVVMRMALTLSQEPKIKSIKCTSPATVIAFHIMVILEF